VGPFLDGAIAKVQAAMQAATSSMQFEKCIELRSNLEVLLLFPALYLPNY
jgi:excinuclease UvrABC nuclease subunit